MNKMSLQDGYQLLLRVSAALLSEKYLGEYTMTEWNNAEWELNKLRKKILLELEI